MPPKLTHNQAVVLQTCRIDYGIIKLHTYGINRYSIPCISIPSISTYPLTYEKIINFTPPPPVPPTVPPPDQLSPAPTTALKHAPLDAAPSPDTGP